MGNTGEPMKIGKKFFIILSVTTITVLALGQYATFRSARNLLEQESFNKLTAVREMKANQIEDYFQQINNQIVTLSENRMLVEAMGEFKKSFQTVAQEQPRNSQKRENIDNSLEQYYTNDFLPRFFKGSGFAGYFPLSQELQTEAKNRWLSAMGTKPQSNSEQMISNTKGKVTLTGGSNVLSLVARLAQRFKSQGAKTEISYNAVGTTEGVEEFCGGKTLDLVAASRPMTDNERADCDALGRKPIEFPLALDAIAVVTSNQNNFATNLTQNELVKAFSSAQYWSDIRKEWPKQPIQRYIPNPQEDTFSFFAEQIFQGNNQVILDASQTEILELEDNIPAEVEQNPYAIAFLDYDSYFENATGLKLLKLNGVEPIPETVQQGDYPLSRLLFIYADEKQLPKKPQTREFLKFILSNIDEELGASLFQTNYIPQENKAKILQNLYIASNPYPVGAKKNFDKAEDGSNYSKIHATYHPLIRNFLERFGYYDIFLIDADTGNIVYSVFKEVDYATSLLSGPYKNTNFAKAFQLARDAEKPDTAFLVDFAPYAPSYNAPASFIASPIYDEGKKIGVLVFQLPVDRINDIMTNRQEWSKVGLGESGETYLVGDDFLLRNQSRFLIEDRENYLKAIAKMGIPTASLNKIKNLNSSIGLQTVKTKGTKAALQGETGTAFFPDYRGILVLSAYSPVEIPNVHWAIMSEIDEAEAFSYIRTLQWNVLFATVGLVGITLGAANVAFRRMEVQLKQSLENLEQTTIVKQRMENELGIGRDIQMSMLPLTFPTFPNRLDIDICALLEPAREVGGDFYDFSFLHEDNPYLVEENLLYFCVGDVSGKGVPAALFMAVTKTLIKSQSEVGLSAAEILTIVNQEISADNPSCMFITLFFGILDLISGELNYSNAGHNPPYLLREDGTVETLKKRHGPPLGAMEDIAYQETKVILNSGDYLIVYTDGVTEAMDVNENLFTEERLVSVLTENSPYNSSEEITKTISKVVFSFQGEAEQADDLTILAIKYIGQSPNTEAKVLEITIKNDAEEILQVQDGFEAFAEQQEIPVAIVRKLCIVFDELLSNTIFYAYPDEKEHEITIKVELTTNKLKVSITDDGIPFNPLQAETPDLESDIEDRAIGGLGIHLVRELMDEVTYHRNLNQNILTLSKFLAG